MDLNKKRGRKPKSQSKDHFILTTKNKKKRQDIKGSIIKLKNTNNNNIPVNLILHLPISSKNPKIENKSNIIITSDEPDNIVFNKPKNKENETRLKPANKSSNIGFKFIKLNEWNKETDILCWWCTHSFTNVPCSIPFSYTLDFKFEVFGCFCSFNCALAYILDKNIEKKSEKISLLHMLYRKIFKQDEIIEPAPPKEILQEYGGTLNIEEFRKLSITKEISKDIVLPPIIGVKAQIDSRNIQESIKYMNRKSIISFDTSVSSSDNTVILKRHAPINNNNDFMKHFKKL